MATLPATSIWFVGVRYDRSGTACTTVSCAWKGDMFNICNVHLEHETYMIDEVQYLGENDGTLPGVDIVVIEGTGLDKHNNVSICLI